MKHRVTIYMISIFLLVAFKSTAQYENVWAFGDAAGLDFNSGAPQAIKTSIKTNEGCASICDASGQLLFYTDGASAWDRNNDLMPHGADLLGIGKNITFSCSQGALIVPVPGNVHRYYVFSLGDWESKGFFGKVYYNIVDMSLNNGLGDVVYKKAVLLDSLLTEHMAAVSGNDCNIWLVVVSRPADSFKAYNITLNGIDLQPVISPGAFHEELRYYYEISGSMEVSPDRSKLAISQDKLILYDFDPASGKITHPVVLDTAYIPPLSAPYYSFATFYGLSFSPDSKKLYVSLLEQAGGIWQFDLSSGDSLAMINSGFQVTNDYIYGLKRAPDGKIYGAAYNGKALSVISKPDLAGAACQYKANALPLAAGTNTVFGLPNHPMIITKRNIYHSYADTAFCAHQLLLSAKNTSGAHYVWDNGSTDTTRDVDRSGIYWVSYQTNTSCMLNEWVDTFKVVFDFSRKNIYSLTKDSGMCKADTLLLKAMNASGSDYQWNDGSIGMQHAINQPGTYWLSYRVDSLCEDHIDSFIITYPLKDYEVSFTSDTALCQQDTIYFQNTSDAPFNQFKWTFGDQQASIQESPAHLYSDSGTYRVMLVGRINTVCPDTAYSTVEIYAIPYSPFRMDQDSICSGATVTFTPQSRDKTITAYNWVFGDGTLRTVDPGETVIQHAYDHPGIMPVTLHTKFHSCPDTAFTDTVYVYALPDVTLGPDTSLCLHDTPIVLKNLRRLLNGTYHYQWNTGDTTDNLKVLHPGIYSLTVSAEPLGCNSTAFVKVAKDCYIDIPNAFTPNGDGENDYFFPRQLLSRKITQFKMQIFNRWGGLVFESSRRDGRGWDGRLNGKPQPEGVYLYLVDIEMNGSSHEHYQGNITLLR